MSIRPICNVLTVYESLSDLHQHVNIFLVSFTWRKELEQDDVLGAADPDVLALQGCTDSTVEDGF